MSEDSKSPSKADSFFSEKEVSDVESGESGTEPSEGGLQGWLTVAGSWFILFGTLGYFYGFGVYQDYYTRVYLNSHPPSSVTWIGTFQLSMLYLFGFFSGKLFDHGHFYMLQISGCLVFTFSLFMLSLARPQEFYQVFLAQGVGMGLGVGLTFIPTVSVLSQYFTRRRGLATGIALTGASCGAIVFPICATQFEKESFGRSVRASAYLVLASLCIGCALMRTKATAQETAAARAVSGKDIKRWLTERPYQLAMLGGFFYSLGASFPTTYLRTYAVQHNIDPTLAFYSLAILNGSGALGRVVANIASDIIGPFNLLVPCTLVVAATIWATLGITNTATLVVVSLVYGIFSSMFLSLSVTALAGVAKDRSELGARTGLGINLGFLGILFSTPIQDALLTSDFVWIRPIIFSAIMATVSTVLMFSARTVLTWKSNSQRV